MRSPASTPGAVRWVPAGPPSTGRRPSASSCSPPSAPPADPTTVQGTPPERPASTSGRPSASGAPAPSAAGTPAPGGSGANGSRKDTLRCTGPASAHVTGPPLAPAAAPTAPCPVAASARHTVERQWAAEAAVTDSGAGRSHSQRTAPAKIPGCTVVWLAPVPRSSAGRSADSTSRGMPLWCASSTAGCRFATAVPDVVTTGTGRPPTRARPSARKPAERSSIRTWSRSRPARSAASNAYARGAEREPGARTASRTPPRTSSSTTTVARAADGCTPRWCHASVQHPGPSDARPGAHRA